jgi:hypothetical protein
MRGHQCPATGCTVQVPTNRLFCPRHWFSVPKALRDKVWASYRAGNPDHLDVCQEAIEAVNATLAKERR